MVRELMKKPVKSVSVDVRCSDDFIVVICIVWLVVIRSFLIQKNGKWWITSRTSVFLWSSPASQSFSLSVSLTFSISVSLCHFLSFLSQVINVIWTEEPRKLGFSFVDFAQWAKLFWTNLFNQWTKYQSRSSWVVLIVFENSPLI